MESLSRKVLASRGLPEQANAIRVRVEGAAGAWFVPGLFSDRSQTVNGLGGLCYDGGLLRILAS